MLNQFVLLIIASIISYAIGWHFHQKSVSLTEKDKKLKIKRIKQDYSLNIAYQLITDLLNGNVKMELDHEILKSTLSGKIKREFSSDYRVDFEDISELIETAIAIIDEERFVDSTIKKEAKEKLYANINTKSTPYHHKKPQKYYYELLRGKPGINMTPYVVSLALVFLNFLILWLLVFAELSVNPLVVLSVIGSIIFSSWLLLDLDNNLIKISSAVKSIVKAYTVLSLGAVMINVFLSPVLENDPHYKYVLGPAVFSAILVPVIYAICITAYIVGFYRYKKNYDSNDSQ